jgi:hypothetical protein
LHQPLEGLLHAWAGSNDGSRPRNSGVSPVQGFRLVMG